MRPRRAALIAGIRSVFMWDLKALVKGLAPAFCVDGSFIVNDPVGIMRHSQK